MPADQEHALAQLETCYEIIVSALRSLIWPLGTNIYSRLFILVSNHLIDYFMSIYTGL